MTAALLLDKPAGATSHDVVARVRRERRGAKAGHAGTLDPFATGLLIVLVGRATRLQRYLLELPKTYLAEARLGWRSTTGDPDGELTETGRIPERLELPTGQVTQRVPMTSAIRVGGERLYRKAHRGEEVVTPERTVSVHRAELVGRGEGTATFEIECSSGTYVRTLVETLDDAYCSALRRTAIGPHQVPEDDEIEITANELLSFMQARELSNEEANWVSHGRPVMRGRGAGPGAPPRAVSRPGAPPPGAASEHVRLIHEGHVLAVARRDGENLRPEVVLA